MAERNVIAIAIALYSAYKIIEKQRRYLPAKNYNVTLLYQRNQAGEALIEKLMFTHKSSQLSVINFAA